MDEDLRSRIGKAIEDAIEGTDAPDDPLLKAMIGYQSPHDIAVMTFGGNLWLVTVRRGKIVAPAD
jgi:hypothetical protein